MARGLLGGSGKGLPDFFTPDLGDPGGSAGKGFGFFATPGKDVRGVVSPRVLTALKSVRKV